MQLVLPLGLFSLLHGSLAKAEAFSKNASFAPKWALLVIMMVFTILIFRIHHSWVHYGGRDRACHGIDVMV
jgi:hypothetical protein